MAEIFDKTSPGPSEHVLICAVREAYTKPFQATDWSDLRVGFFLSITDDTADDTITGLTEDIGATNASPIAFSDRVLLGIGGGPSPDDFVFLGYTNAGVGRVDPSLGKSQLVSSDASGGTTNSDYWRVDNGRNSLYGSQIIQNDITRAAGGQGERPHFPQNFAGGHAPGYAALHMLRFTRSGARGRERIITMQIPHDPTVTLYSSTPTKAILDSNLQAFPTTSIHTLGPVELSHVPDRMYFNWPFHNSRLRIHCDGVLKVA